MGTIQKSKKNKGNAFSMKLPPDKSGFFHLSPVAGGEFDHFRKMFTGIKLPKDPEVFLYDLVETYGVSNVVNMTEVDIARYVYNKGMNYALNMSVGRNIPWIEDGLKSVERRALYIMWTMKLSGGHTTKVASIVGRMIEKVYPHGDFSPANTIYRLGRKRSTMMPYVTPGGDFGNMDEMRPASPRYASASLSPYAIDCFFSEIGVRAPLYDVRDNYNFSDVEPVFLTSRYPNSLLQWNQGFGEGAASWLGAFNSRDIFKAALTLLDDPMAKIEIYPDFPIPVQIINKEKLKECFDQSTFRVQTRAPYEVVLDHAMENGHKVEKHTIVFTALPLSVIGSVIRKQITKIVQEDSKKTHKRLPEIKGLDIIVDDVTPGGIRLIIEYEKGYDPHAIVEKLYRMTSLAKTIGVNYTLVTDNWINDYTPRQILNIWISQRFDQKRRYYHQKALHAAKERARLEAICTILRKDNTDKAIAIIRGASNETEACKGLQKAFDFTEFQARMILQVRLSNLPKMSITDTERQCEEALTAYRHYRKLLTDETAIKDAIRSELEEGLKKYGRPRMAPLLNLETEDPEDMSSEKIIVYDDETYYSVTNDDDFREVAGKVGKQYNTITVKNRDMLMLVDRRGNLRVLNGTAFSETKSGIGTVNLGMKSLAKVLPFDESSDYDHILILTRFGYGKMMDYREIIKSGKGRLTVLAEGDEIADIIPIRYDSNHAGDDIVCAWQGDQMYYVHLYEFPKLKRAAMGNRVFKLKGTKDPCFERMTYFSMKTTDLIMLYGESGYVKFVDTMFLGFPKRYAASIAMNGKAMIGAIPLSRSKVNRCVVYDQNGKTPLEIVVDKQIHFRTGDDVRKLKLSTTIGNPTKVFRKSKLEYYTIM